MTPAEHDHVQKLEGQVKRYRNRIVALKLLVRVAHGEGFEAGVAHLVSEQQAWDVCRARKDLDGLNT